MNGGPENPRVDVETSARAPMTMARERHVERPRSLGAWWKRLVARPELVRVVHVHAPVALAGGRTPIEIIASGVGLLIVDDARHLVVGVFHRTIRVRVQPRVTVRFIGLAGAASQVLPLESVVSESPRRIVVESNGLPLFVGDDAVVVMRVPQPLPVELEALAPARAPLRTLASVRAVCTPLRTHVNESLTSLFSRAGALSIRIRLPGGPDDSP